MISDKSDDIDADEEDDEVRPHRGEREEAFEAYIRAVRAQARAAIAERSVSRRSRNGQILGWLGARSLGEAELLTLGQKLRIRPHSATLPTPYVITLHVFPVVIAAFEKSGQQLFFTWYRASTFEPNENKPARAGRDYFLVILRASNTILLDKNVLRLIDEPRFAPLKITRELYRTQIAVDETTNFRRCNLRAWLGSAIRSCDRFWCVATSTKG